MPGVRCLYVDLDGTLLGAGGAVTRDGEGGFTLLGIRALEACHRAGALVCAMSGRPRAVLARRRPHPRARRVHLRGGRRLRGRRRAALAGRARHPRAHRRVGRARPAARALPRAARAPHAVLPGPRGLAHPARPHRRRGGRGAAAEHGHDDLRLIDNGEAHHHSAALAGLPSVRLYHLLPGGVSSPRASPPTCAPAASTREECVAVGDSGEDLTVAEVVGAFWLVANAFELDPGLRAELGAPPERPRRRGDARRRRLRGRGHHARARR